MSKTFKANLKHPAMNFISEESIEKVEGKPEAPAAEEVTSKEEVKTPSVIPQGYKPDPRYIETKSKRLQLLVRPSLNEKLKKRAQEKGLSVNELVNIILEREVEKE